MHNPYEILGVVSNASPKEITRAFRKMALKYHPDRNKSADTTTRFKEVYEAYAVLKDAATRAEYDNKKYESQRFGARTRAKKDLLRTDPLQATLERLKKEIFESKRYLDKEFKDYESNAKTKSQSLREEMRNMASV